MYPIILFDIGEYFVTSVFQTSIVGNTVELQWLEHLWNHEMFETEVVGAKEC